jgi:Flp pilus assembly protein TadG
MLADRLHYIAAALEQRRQAMPSDFTHWLPSAITRLWHDERGVSAIMVAVSLTVLIGFAGLGVETGLWYAIKRQNQSAADAAAISAAYEVMAGNTNVTSNLTPAATRAATQNGYTGATPVVTYPYSDSIVSNAVAVTLRKTQTTLLAGLFLPSVTIETKAVARVFPAAPGCILTLGTSGEDVEVQGSSTLSAPDCSIMAASTDNCAINDHDQGGQITAKYLITAGQVSYGQNCTVFDPTNPPSNLSANLMTGVASQEFTDPYGASSGTTAFTNPCTGTSGYLSHAFLSCNIPAATSCATPPASSGSKPTTFYAGGNNRFCGGLSIQNAVVDLLPPVTGAILSVNVTNNGSNYGCVPRVTFGGGGSGATATATLTGKNVTAITVTSVGSGYTSPTVSISPGSCGSGSGATATATAQNSTGVYWITDDGCSAGTSGCGDLAFGSGGTLECTQCDPSTGKGVTIIFTSTKTSGVKIGAPTGNANAVNSLNAPTSGTYAGLLMVQDTVSGATYTSTASFQGNTGQTLNGLIYMPNSNLTFQGNPSVTNSCLLVVSKTLTLNGNSSLATGGCPSSLPLPEVKNVALAS